MHIFGKLAHIFGKLAHIFGKLVHIFGKKLVPGLRNNFREIWGHYGSRGFTMILIEEQQGSLRHGREDTRATSESSGGNSFFIFLQIQHFGAQRGA